MCQILMCRLVRSIIFLRYLIAFPACIDEWSKGTPRPVMGTYSWHELSFGCNTGSRQCPQDSDRDEALSAAVSVCVLTGSQGVSAKHTPVGVVGARRPHSDLLHKPGAPLRAHQQGGQGPQLCSQEAHLVHSALLEPQHTVEAACGPSVARQRMQGAFGTLGAELPACRLRTPTHTSRCSGAVHAPYLRSMRPGPV